MHDLISCISCNPELQASIFRSSSGMLLAKLLFPLIFCAMAILSYQRSKNKSYTDGSQKPQPVIAFSLLLGIGMGGFTDGIVLHQLLQWHQMISNVLPPDSLEAKNINMFWDGVFHVVTWTVTFVGILLMWKSMKRSDLLLSHRLFAGGMIAGWGMFNLLDSIFNHYLFKLHNVRENVSNPELWNLGFLIFSLLLIGCGWLLMRGPVQKKRISPLLDKH